MPLVITRALAAAGCSLDTLHISPSWSRRDDAVEIFYDKDLHQAIAALPVRCKITVMLPLDKKLWRDSLEYMVHRVGLIKQWAITEEFSRMSGIGPVPATSSEIFFVAVLSGYDREWTLEPACASTIDKVPSSEDVDKIYRRLQKSNQAIACSREGNGSCCKYIPCCTNLGGKAITRVLVVCGLPIIRFELRARRV